MRPAPLVMTTKLMTTRIDEHHDADGVVAADQEMTERFDHLARRIRTGVPLQQHHARRGDVERQAQQRGDQQHGREHGKVERLGGIHRRPAAP